MLRVALSVLLGSVAVIVVIVPLLIGLLISRRRGRPLPPRLADRDGPSPLAGYVMPDADLYFWQDPLGAHSLPRDLELPTTSVDTYVDLMSAGVLTPAATRVDTTWTPWGYLGEGEDATRDVSARELESLPT